ncbi:MAG: hypothetical protein MZV64_11650 [Ignavibacteriales bacterium]|nr:hypothetical protein [Ignavibacteriales bacterium]
MAAEERYKTRRDPAPEGFPDVPVLAPSPRAPLPPGEGGEEVSSCIVRFQELCTLRG